MDRGLPEPVVVLGGGGFIGSHLVAALVDRGYATRAVDVLWPTYREASHEGAARVTADMTTSAGAVEAVTGAGTVFHLAADMGGVGYFHSDADTAAAFRNGRMTMNVLEAADFARVERLFYASSACAYPVDRDHLTEDMLGTGEPDALYGADKLHGIRLCAAFPFARVGVLDTVYGPLATWDGPRAKFPAAVTAKALRAKKTGVVELWGDGGQVRSFLYVTEAVDRIIRVTAADHYEGPVNICGAVPTTCREIADLCLSHLGIGAVVRTGAQGPTGTQCRVSDGDAYRARYGPAPERSYAEGFGATVDWLATVV